MFRFNKFLVLLSAVVIFTSCRKDNSVVADEPPPVTPTAPAPATPSVAPSATGNVTFKFDAMSGNKPLEYDSVWYYNSSKELFTVSKFNYYITNIRLKKTDGTYFAEPE